MRLWEEMKHAIAHLAIADDIYNRARLYGGVGIEKDAKLYRDCAQESRSIALKAYLAHRDNGHGKGVLPRAFSRAARIAR
jgi:hypothetical protein